MRLNRRNRGRQPSLNPSALHVDQIINLPRAENSSGPNGCGSRSSSVGSGYVFYSGPASHLPDPKT